MNLLVQCCTLEHQVIQVIRIAATKCPDQQFRIFNDKEVKSGLKCFPKGVSLSKNAYVLIYSQKSIVVYGTPTKKSPFVVTDIPGVKTLEKGAHCCAVATDNQSSKEISSLTPNRKRKGQEVILPTAQQVSTNLSSHDRIVSETHRIEEDDGGKKPKLGSKVSTKKPLSVVPGSPCTKRGFVSPLIIKRKKRTQPKV